MGGQEEREQQKGGCGMAVVKTLRPAQKTTQGGCLAAAGLTRRLTGCCKW